MKKSRLFSFFGALLCAFLLAMGGTACGGDDPATNQVDGDGDGDGDAEVEPRTLAQAHQLCAAAGESSDGMLTALHCFGPHDLSGFEATNDSEMTWQPGAFHIVAE